MKQETLNTLITARALFDKAQEMCAVDDKYIASAGLVILQDSLELVIYTCLVELNADKDKSLESLTFDQLIGELKKNGKPIQKAGTLKALNKQRVIIKHYGQIADPATVRGYYEAAKQSTDALLRDVIGKDLQEILLAEAISNDVIREHIATACTAIENTKYFDALVEIRKAIYSAIEVEYSVFDWKDHPQGKKVGIFESLEKGGNKAPWHTKNKEWIEQNIHDPFDYMQLDHERLRIDLLEWGISTQDYWNVWRLTPQVFYDKEAKTWEVNLDLRHFRAGATEANARYCLDRAVSILIKKQSHLDLSRQLGYGPEYSFQVRMNDDQPLYAKASTKSETSHTLQKGQIYQADSIVAGLSENTDFIKISHAQNIDPRFLVGYVLYGSCEIIEPQTS